MSNNYTFNRTTFGIEIISLEVCHVWLFTTFNRTTFGIEIYNSNPNFEFKIIAFNRTTFGIEIIKKPAVRSFQSYYF